MKASMILIVVFLLLSNIVFARYLDDDVGDYIKMSSHRVRRSLRVGKSDENSGCDFVEKKAVNRCWRIKNLFDFCRTVFVTTCQLKKKISA